MKNKNQKLLTLLRIRLSRLEFLAYRLELEGYEGDDSELMQRLENKICEVENKLTELEKAMGKEE